MQILLCAATRFEIEPTLQWLQSKKLNNKIETLITGIGLTAATYHILKKISTQTPKLVIQAGVGGSLTPNLKRGTCVAINNENIGDLGVEEAGIFTNIFNLKIEDNNEPPYTNGSLNNHHVHLLQLAALPIVDAVSVNEISTSEKRIQYYKESLNASVESMEGAALHYVCLQEDVPFVQLRSISNFIGERDKTKWNLPLAIENLNTETIAFIKKIIEL